MKTVVSFIIVSVLSLSAYAHDMTPTYPQLKYSWKEGLLETELEVFNKRNDVDYYEIGVFTEDWEPVAFVSSFKIFKLDYLERIRFTVYIREDDKNRATYVCSKSRSRNVPAPTAVISSTICSKFKKDDL